jgi:C1A family cysteine protease
MATRKKIPKKKSRLHTYGWKPDLPDHRDIRYGAVYGIPPKLPKNVDLRPICSAVEDQGTLGSCTAHALTSAFEAVLIKDTLPFAEMSRLFLYYNERVMEHTADRDSGAMIRDGIKSLVKQGCCREDAWPYDIAKFINKPGPACYADGLKRQVTSYQRIETLDQMRACLASGYPFVFGFTVYESFESQAVAKTGVVPMPGPKERPLGGHAVMAAGYNDSTKRFLVCNSWGTGWGQKGYFTMPYDYLSNRDLSDDIWTIRAVEDGK